MLSILKGEVREKLGAIVSPLTECQVQSGRKRRVYMYTHLVRFRIFIKAQTPEVREFNSKGN